MARRPTHGGGWRAIGYTWRKAREAGPIRLWRAMSSKNACKTCALGMGGQLGGMRSESGHFPEFCKKSLQAMVADMQGRIEPRFFATYSVAQLQAMSPRELEHAGRIVEPLLLEAGSQHYRPISWDAAFEIVSGALQRTDPRRAFFYASGRSSNEAGFLLQLFARRYGTNHVGNCSFYCHQASGVGLADTIGLGTATLQLEDLRQCDLFFLIGANPASNHPRLMESLMRLRRRGGRVIVVNPLRESGLEAFRIPSDPRSLLFGSEIASLYLQPKIGGDIALLTGIAKAVLALQAEDRRFLEGSTDNFELWRASADANGWEEIERSSGVERALLEEAARLYSESHRSVFGWTMGITHHLHGVENVQAIVNLCLLRGMVGKPGAGLLPIRGHSNVQGMGTVGVTPTLSRHALERLQARGVCPPDWDGYDTLASLHAADRGEFDFALCLGGNLYGASPDAAFCRRALGKVQTVVYVGTTLNTGHAHGLGVTTLVLPALARDEEPEATTQESMFSYVRLSDGGPARHEGPRSESSILAEIAARTLGADEAIDWPALASPEEVRQWIAAIVPNLEPIAEIGKDRREFHIAGRLLRTPTFPTPSGRARFRPIALPVPPDLPPNGLQLMTIRSEGQFNTVVYEEEDLYRGQERRDVILLNPADMARLGIAENQPVRVRSEAGEMRGLLARPYEIAAGCAAMYYPEANVLIPAVADPRSKTPAYKSAPIQIFPDGTQTPDADHAEFTTQTGRAGMRAC